MEHFFYKNVIFNEFVTNNQRFTFPWKFLSFQYSKTTNQISQNYLRLDLKRFFKPWVPSTHTTLFWRLYDVILMLWTFYRRQNDVVCVLGWYILFQINYCKFNDKEIEFTCYWSCGWEYHNHHYVSWTSIYI